MTNVSKKPRIIRDRIKTAAVHWVVAKFKCSEAFVYATLRGDYAHTSESELSREVKKAFNAKYQELKKAMEL